MTQTTAYEHLVINESGVAIIEVTSMKVIELTRAQPAVSHFS